MINGTFWWSCCFSLKYLDMITLYGWSSFVWWASSKIKILKSQIFTNFWSSRFINFWGVRKRIFEVSKHFFTLISFMFSIECSKSLGLKQFSKDFDCWTARYRVGTRKAPKYFLFFLLAIVAQYLQIIEATIVFPLPVREHIMLFWLSHPVLN